MKADRDDQGAVEVDVQAATQAIARVAIKDPMHRALLAAASGALALSNPCCDQKRRVRSMAQHISKMDGLIAEMPSKSGAIIASTW